MAPTQSMYIRKHIHKKIIIVALILITSIGCLWATSTLSLSGSNSPNSTLNLLQSGWDYVPGVIASPDGLHVSYLGRAIVKQDGSPGQDNPSVNTYGSHLHTTGDFTITAAMQDIIGEASLRLYDSPPIIQDEFRVEPRSIDFRVKDSTLTISRWNGYKNENLQKQKPIKLTTHEIIPQTNSQLVIQRAGDILSITFNGKKVQTLAYGDTFAQDIWFGLSAANQNNTWTLTKLEVNAENPQSISVINTQNTPIDRTDTSVALQSVVAKKRPDFLIGAATALVPAVYDKEYRRLAFGGNFGMITTENSLKWQFIHPQQNVYDFKEADALITLAKNNGLQVQGHTLVFGEANPKWVQDLPVTTNADKEKIKQIMIDHITQTVAHYKGKVAAWDVVNEPLADYDAESGTLRTHKWYAAMGDEYIATAFRAARQADPAAKLYINDYGLEHDGDRWKTMLALVTKLKTQGVPIDGVGFEAHVYEMGDEITPATLRSHIKALAAIGVSSHISEMDVHDDNGTAAQARQYADIIDTCVREPSCTSWATWGVTDKYNLYASDNGKLQYGHDFLWNNKYAPTPAVFEIQKIFQ